MTWWTGGPLERTGFTQRYSFARARNRATFRSQADAEKTCYALVLLNSSEFSRVLSSYLMIIIILSDIIVYHYIPNLQSNDMFFCFFFTFCLKFMADVRSLGCQENTPGPGAYDVKDPNAALSNMASRKSENLCYGFVIYIWYDHLVFKHGIYTVYRWFSYRLMRADKKHGFSPSLFSGS